MLSKKSHKWLLVLGFLIFTFRFCTINIFGGFNIFYYDLLAKNFTLGKLYVKQAPEALLKLSNPYDTNLNKEFRIQKNMHDLCLYKGKLYMHWGPIPALLISPFKFFSNVRIMDGLIFLIVLTATQFLFLNTLWLIIFYTYKKAISIFFIIISFLTFNLLPNWSVIANRIAGYEIGIVFNQFFISGFLFFFFLAYKKKIDTGITSLQYLTLSSVSLGLAIGSRFSSICLLPAFLLAWYFWINLIPYEQKKERLTNALALGIPVTFCILLIFIYNYVRFDNFFEYGQKWVLSIDPVGFKFIDPSRIIPNLYYNFFIPPKISLVFPYFKPSFPYPLFWMSPSQVEQFPYKLATCIQGFFVTVPLAMSVFAIPYLKKKISIESYQKQKPIFIFFTLLMASSLCLLLPYLCTGVTMRYTCEWTFLWLSASLSAIQIILNQASSWNKRYYYLLIGLIIVCTLWTILIGILISFDKTYSL
ncbi:MAG: hypothetical protein V4525_09320 [Pseudomonadota bacterium]